MAEKKNNVRPVNYISDW